MSVRVIKAAGAPAPRARTEGTVRRIDAARWQAQVESERLLAEAGAEARAIVARAQAEAQSIAARAEAEGRARAEAQTAALWIAARAEAEKVAVRATEVVIAATRAVSERALGRALATDDASLSAWAGEAIAALAGARRIALHAHPHTLARIDLPVTKVEAEIEEGVLLVRGDLGDVKLELSTQVDALVAAIRELLASEVARRA